MCFCAVKTARTLVLIVLIIKCQKIKPKVEPQSFKVLVLFNKIQPKKLQSIMIENIKDADVC